MSVCADGDLVTAPVDPPDRPPTGRTTAIARVAGAKSPSANAVFVAERGVLNTFTGTGTTQVVTLASTCTAGNTVFLIFVARVTTAVGHSVSDSRGNTWTIDVGPTGVNNNLVFIASTRQNAGTLLAADTVTVTFSAAPGNDRYALLEEFANLPPTVSLDKTAFADNAGTGSCPTGTTAPTSERFELAIAAWCLAGTDPPIHDAAYRDFPSWHLASPGQPADGLDKNLVAQYRILSEIGPQVAVMTVASPHSYQGMIGTYRTIGGGGGI